MTTKIFHTADLHLGMCFTGYPEIQEELIHARYATLEDMVKVANQAECELFIVAGDLFDRVTVKIKEIIRAARILNEFEGTQVIVLPGNHDYYIPESKLWNEFGKHAGDRVLVLKEPGVYDLSKFHLDIKIYACPCHAKHSAENRLGWIGPDHLEKDDSIRIGVAHGSLEGVSPDFDRTYYPMTRKELETFGFELWLLGHTHLPWPDRPDKNSRILIPGTPEPDGFDCKHRGHAFIITLAPSSDKKIQKIATGKYQFLVVRLLLRDENSIHHLEKEYTQKKYQNAVLRFILKGRLKKEELEKVEEVLKLIKDHVLFLQTNRDELHEEITPELINSEFTQGSFPHQLLLSLLKEKEEISSKALQKAYDMIREIRHEN